MMNHAFIFTAGVWKGSGSISFSMADDILEFTTLWTVLPSEDGNFYFSQEIAIQGLSETMRNQFTLRPLNNESFDIVLENQIIGKVMGSGLISDETIAWEFRRKDQEFEGYEIYELQEDGSYKMKAEFTAGAGLRTYVSGQIFPN